jgi:ABC-type antimicrobial peptide transport system permease subunit
VFRLAIGGVVRVIAVGVTIGLALSLALGRLLTTMLFGVQPIDVLTFAVVIAVLGLTAVAAMSAPAWRATRIDPVVALRGE